MNWELYRWVWKVESPLYIGMPPSGSLNRCRPYIPARVLWGAITAELARQRITSTVANLDKHYGDLGNDIKKDIRFTYLYPAMKRNDDYAVWLPEFDIKNGLQWTCKSRNESKSYRKFRTMLFSALAGTAIDPDTDSAQDASLHETECIQPFWRIEDTKVYHPVYLIGYFITKTESDLIDEINSVNMIFAGGDTRYGLGRLQLVQNHATGSMQDFCIDANLNTPEPRLTANRVLAHAEINNKNIIGAQEGLLGWDRGNLNFLHYGRNPYWIPGSTYQESPGKISWNLLDDGTWKAEEEH